MADMGTKEASELWGYKQSTVSKWCREGLIPSAIQDKKRFNLAYFQKCEMSEENQNKAKGVYKMNMKQKNICSLFILICGTILVITGIVVLAFAENHCGISGGGISRANTEITFGADYYTTMAQYTALNANAMVDTYNLLKNCFGIIFIFSGLLTIFLNLPNALKILKSKNKFVVTETTKDNNENLITEEKV